MPNIPLPTALPDPWGHVLPFSGQIPVLVSLGTQEVQLIADCLLGLSVDSFLHKALPGSPFQAGLPG